jgi:predicted nuclease of predicted toxin-antitoxin system
MKFLADENLPASSVKILRQAGLDIASIGEDNPSVKDEEVIDISNKENRIIITFDSDYGELVFHQGHKITAGVIFLRLGDFLPEEPAKLLLDMLKENEIEFEGLFTVIERDNIRQKLI